MAAILLLCQLLFLCIVPSWTYGLFGDDDRAIIGECKGSCEKDLRHTNEGGSQLFCDQTCSVEQCWKGCTLYEAAVNSSCPRACTASYHEIVNVTGPQSPSQDQMRNCIQGCIFALDRYSIVIKDYIGYLDQPVLDRDSLNATSLTLKWKTPILSQVSYKLQKKMVGVDNGWHLHGDTAFSGDGRIELTSLHPYVTYKFKVLALLSPLPDHIMYSNETAEITTLAQGAPSTPPYITSLSTPSPRVISLSWSPPQFTNGKLIGYRIYVEPLDHPILNQTTIEVLANTSSWLLSQLQSSQKYKISLSAWNAEGEGPRHSRVISTPNPGNLSEHETAYLILGMQNKIIKRNILDVIQHATKYSDNVYANPNTDVRTTAGTEDTLVYRLKRGLVFKDLGIHIRKQLIFATDSNGQVTKIHLNGQDPVPNIYRNVYGARAIAVDWLGDRVYVATTERIYSCPLEQDRCVVVVQGLLRTPSDLKVDPINGFIYFVIPGYGLYRVDLGDIPDSPPSLSRPYPAVGPSTISRQPALTMKPQLVVAMSDLLTHIIDLYNVHLYVVNNKARKMMTTFLDGSNARLFHERIIRSEFFNVSSMIFFNQTFIWTNGTKMFVEEHESPLKDYRHNEMLFFEPPYAGINVFHPSTQPTPVPSSAPDNVEGLFSKYRVVVKWMPPPLLQYQGKGAWMNWTYELQMTMLGDDQPKLHVTSGLKYVVGNLKPDTEYSIQVRALSSAGRGPWSKVFIGRTLLEDGLSVLIGLPGGEIIERNISSDSQRSVVSFFSDSTDVAWHDGIIFWVTIQGRLGVYDQTTRLKRTHIAADRAYCVAYDWLAKKVFWSDPSHVAIYRSDINGISSEFIRRTAARDIAIDAMRGRLYWATQNSIETSYLNGDNHQELYVIPPFSGPNVISLTLDMDSERVFWYVKGSDTQSLYVAELIPASYVGQFPVTTQKVGDFKSIASTSGLQYFANRLFWLSEKNSLIMGDSQCNFTATIGEASNITSFVVIQTSNTTKNQLQVIPNQIRSEDIKSEGSWSSFNLTWPKSSEVTHGTVFYRVIIEVGNTNKQLTTTNQWTEMLGLSPYTQLVVSIQPYTYWGYAAPTTVSVRSPMSKPTAPLSPEVYIIQHKNATALHQSLAADFRWMSPALTNGIISHHIVYYWMGDGSGGEKAVVTLKNRAQHYILSPLVKNQVYNFKVVACNDAGCGPESVTKTVVTDALNPIPSLLMATPVGVVLTELDSDFNSSLQVPDISPTAVTYLAQEDTRIFWLDKRNKLYENSGSPFVELLTLNGTGKDLTTDWVSRTMYFVEWTGKYSSAITQFSIDRGVYQPVLSRPAKIYNIVADPYNSALVWIEIDSEGDSQIMYADMTSGDVKVIFGPTAYEIRKRKGLNTKCSCYEDFNFAPVLAMGYMRVDGATEIVFADSINGFIVSSDLNGCMCSVIFKPSEDNRYGLPPSMLAVDHMRVTWYNKTEGKLYSVNKATGLGLIVQEIKDSQDILAYGSHLQPLPDSQCLDPGAVNSTTEALYVDSSSVYLKLSIPQRPSSCQDISAPQDKYTIYYRKVKATKHAGVPEDCQSDISQCIKMESYASNVQIKGLDPYTKYLFQVAVSNYYTEYLSAAMGQQLFVTTKFGVPSVARNLIALPCTPEKMIVKWLPPLQLNGPQELITYVVQYSTFLSEGNVHRETENLFDNKTSDGLIQTVLKDLEPGQLYSIKVLTCMVNRTMCSSSDPVSSQTFKTPSEMKFVSSTPHSISVTWRSPPDDSIIRHHVIYAEVKPGELKWFESGFLSVTENHTDYTEEITGLEPNTLYAFKIKANYRSRPFDMAVYTWPSDDRRYTYRTNVFCPDQPPPPVVRQLKTGMYEVKWEKPDDNGAEIITYILEMSSGDNLKWQSAYNGSDERWLVDSVGLDNGKPYIFRVAAANSQGMGPYSNNSSSFLFSHAPTPATLSHQVIIGIVVGVLVFLIIIVVAVIFLAIRKRQDKITQFIIRGPDTELATLRELPHTTFQQSNTLYAISIKCTDEEIAKLPHFSRNQLVLTMFLGSGAFGEVFEGLAKNILGDSSGETKCAVKTLRKSASDHEKEEFLKEALLMKNFQHENILRLLGVCLDNDPQFIIMELMEGGDLLSFLRSCRATSTSPAKLVLPDLVKICVHVARGCKYLEDMHFVHRDLAARNCLVSSKSTSAMTVKIGDFGLARDIYKNDYYRKEGEGLLPVRWMSPESLVDGVFTTQSDIWAFGVLMWEVLTLGQQPYPARTNIEVLHFVRDGGKLERPEKCTDEMFNLMRKCWSFNSEQRPSFATLLESLEIFQEKCCHMSPEDIARFSPAVTDGGGSVRLTQSAKQKRLNDLLGSPDAPEKLVVDLTKIGRKRTHSLEYSTKEDADSQNQFPAAANYDHNGYLEPRGAKGGPGYLELINYAPELRHLRDAQGNPLTGGPAFTPVHVTRKGYHPSHVNYTLLSPDDDGHSGAYGPDGSDVCGVDEPTYYSTQLPYNDNSGHPYGYVSVEESPIYSRVCDDRRHYSTDSAGRQFGNAPYFPQLSGQSLEAMLLKSNQHRKFSDQDLYFSTKPYRQRQSSSSSSTNDHRYASVECNNNYSNPAKMLGQNSGFSGEAGGSGYLLDNGNGGNSRRRHGSNHSNYLYAKPGIGYPTNGNITLTAKGDNTKPCLGNDSWANNLDDVFLDNATSSQCSSQLPEADTFNYQSQQHHSSRSRGQVYPEHVTAIVGYESNQVSLV